MNPKEERFYDEADTAYQYGKFQMLSRIDSTTLLVLILFSPVFLILWLLDKRSKRKREQELNS